MMNKKKENLYKIMRYLPEKLKEPLLELDKDIDDLCEIRLRSDGPVVLIFSATTGFFSESGRLTSIYSNNVLRVNGCELMSTFEKMCNYSVYSLTRNICNGFITLENGCRVGVYGTAVIDEGKIVSVRKIKGMNIRIPGIHEGVADRLLPLYEKGCSNVLICGPPGSGKTTILRELVRILSDKRNLKISVIDERYEFENYYLGYNTDVLSGYPKPEGIQISLRTLSPEIIVCDEIGTADEINSIRNGLNSGVSFVLSLHCRSTEDLVNKRQFRLLTESAAVDYVAFLREKSGVSEIYNVRELYDECSSTFDDRNSFCTCRKVCSLQYGCTDTYVGKD